MLRSARHLSERTVRALRRRANWSELARFALVGASGYVINLAVFRSEEHTSELQSQSNLVCRLLLEKKKTTHARPRISNGTFPLYPPSGERLCLEPSRPLSCRRRQSGREPASVRGTS